MINHELTDITKKSGIVFLGRILGVIFGFFFSVLAARYMGASAYGKIMYVITIITAISIVTKLGLTQGLVQFVAKLSDKKEYIKRNSLISFSILIVLSFSILMSALLFFSSKFIAVNIFNNIEIAALLRVMSPILILFSLIEITPGIFRGLHIVKYQVIGRDLIQSLIRLISVFILGYLGYKLSGLVISYYISMTISIIYLLYKLYRLRLIGKIKKEYIKSYKKILVFSSPLLVSGLLHYLIGKIDIFMIGYFLESTEVGIYIIALKIATLANFLLFSINSIFAPKITSLFYNNQMEKLKRLYQVLTKWIFATNLTAFFIILVLSRDIMNIFGNEFIFGWLALILIAAGQVINAGVGSAGLINIMTGYPHSELYISSIVFILNAVLNYLLIPIYGIEGAAIASLISIGILNLLRLYILYNRLNFLPYNKNYLKVITAIIIGFIVASIISPYIQLHYLIRIILIGFIYLTVIVLLNFIFGLEEEDMLILNKILDKLNLKMNI